MQFRLVTRVDLVGNVVLWILDQLLLIRSKRGRLETSLKFWLLLSHGQVYLTELRLLW